MWRLWCRRWVGLYLMCCIFVACGNPSLPAASTPKQVESFTFINQDGQTMKTADLKGRVWVANFIFTHCPNVCPPMTANMAKIQQQAKKQELDVTFVSFSVDPAQDTPSVLKEYGKKFDVDFSNWHFATGYTAEEIAKFAKFNFSTLVSKDEDTGLIAHGTMFYIIDSQGRIVASVDGVSQFDIGKVLEEIKKVK